MRKTLYLILLFISVVSLYAEGTWGIKASHPGWNLTNNSFHNMFAYGDSIFIFHGETIVSMPGNQYASRYFIRYTTNGGNTWQNALDTIPVNKFLGVDINDDDWGNMTMYFYPPACIQLSLTYSPTIFTTTDFGKNWTVKQVPIVKETNDSTVYLFKSLDTMRQLYQLGRGNSRLKREVYITYDGWKTHELINIPDVPYWCFANMLNDTDIYCEYGFDPYYSNDRGKTWKQSRLPMNFEEPAYLDTVALGEYVGIPDTKTIFISGGRKLYADEATCKNVAVWKSIDAGATWKLKFSSKDTSMYGAEAMAFNKDGLGMVIGSWDLTQTANRLKTPIYMTSDMGETWKKAAFADSCSKVFGKTYNCAVSTINNCWAYITPYLYKFDPQGKVKVEDDYLNKALLSSAIKLYPNPVRSGSSIQIDLSVLEGERASIKVYTPEGKLIDAYESDSEKYISYTPNASAGVYFMEINTLNNRIIKKIVVE